MWFGWSSISARKIQQLVSEAGGATHFEELVGRLVRIEAADRGIGEGSVTEGPSAPYVKDGKRDLIVTAQTAPLLDVQQYRERRLVTVSLLGAMPPRRPRIFSCKTGKTWSESALDDAREGGTRVLPVLRDGGELVVVTSENLPSPPRGDDPAARGAERDDLRARLAASYSGHTRSSEAELEARITVLDARDIADFIQHRRPMELGESLLLALGVRRHGAFLDWQRWVAVQVKERSRPDFRADEERRAALGALTGYLAAGDASERPLLVIGSPGVGKTRLVQEAVEAAAVTGRVAVAYDPDALLRSLDTDDLVGNAPDVVLVLDDCVLAKVGEVVSRFENAVYDAQGRADRARLVVVTPHGQSPRGAHAPQGVAVVAVAPLGRAECEALVRGEWAAGDEEAVGQVVRLTEGYPWFAVLVARDMRGGAALPVTTTQAAAFAIAERAARERDPRCVRNRVRALFAIIVAGNPDWSALDDATCERLAAAVNLSGRRELEDLLQECHARGVLRRDRRSYITPAAIEREVLRILLDPDDPDGFRMRRLLDHVPERVEALLRRLAALGLSDDDLRRFARAAAVEAERCIADVTSLAERMKAALLLFCARWAPEIVADKVVRLVDEASDEALRSSPRVFDVLRQCFTETSAVTTRFEAMERAVFRLWREAPDALDDGLSLWTRLFLPWIDVTPTPFAARLPVLRRRCMEGPSPDRVRAVRGLTSLLAPGAMLSTPPTRELAPVSERDEDERWRAGWEILLACCDDVEFDVGRAALSGVLERLEKLPDLERLEPFTETLVRLVGRLAEADRVALRATLARMSPRSSSAAGRPLWGALDAATRPDDFRQRLADRLAVPGYIAAREAGADEALLRDGLSGPAYPLLQALDLFTAPGALRAPALLVTAGALDREALLRDPLLQQALTSGEARGLAAWCAGRWRAGRPEDVRGWVADWSSDPSLAGVVIEVIARVGLDDVWVDTLHGLLAREGVNGRGARLLRLGSWQGVSSASARRLCELLLLSGEPEAVALALDRVVERSETGAALLDVAEQTLRAATSLHLVGDDAWNFEQCGLLLLDHGRAEAVCAAAFDAIAHDGLSASALERLVLACVLRAPEQAWAALSERLAGDVAAGTWARGLAWGHLAPLLPVEAVMRWVGGDDGRARLIAQMFLFEGEALPPLARALIVSFGAASTPAQSLEGRLHMTPTAVSSMARFYMWRIEQVRRWQSDPDDAVRAWASRAEQSLARQHVAEAEDEAIARLHYGT